jgi:elongation factor G
MAKHATQAIRAIALVGHGAAGKTTLTEALLHKAGAIPAAGSVDKGTSVCDFDPLEKEFKHSLASALVNFSHSDSHIHLIDTPGYPDFLGQSLNALAAVETAAVVINAQNGIEMVTQRMMQWARERGLCRLIIINKIDAENVDLPALLADIQAAFGKECLPINLPAANGKQVVDCFFNPAGDADFSSVADAHRALVEQVVEVDEKLMETYLEQGDVKAEQLHAPFEQALRDGHLVPVCFTSGRTGAGVKELLDIFARLMPNPEEGNSPPFYKGTGADATEIRAEPDPNKHVLAHVFKIVVDPFVGKLAAFRVFQGTIRRDSQLFIGDGRKPFKVGHLFMLKGKEHVETDACVPGDIAAVTKVDEITLDAVLHDSHDEDHIHLKPMQYPVPMHALALELKRRGDEQRLSEVLHKLAAEDPCFRIDHSGSETVIRGLGDLHMRYILDKMQQQYRVEVVTKPPRIPYRETVAARAEGHHRHKKQSGGAGQFGEVFLKIEPLARGQGFDFVDQVKGGTIPSQFIPAVEKGVREVLTMGPLAGFPMQDVRVIVYDGKHHPVDSKEVAFVAAGKRAFLDAIRKARPLVLEPIVNVQINTPAGKMGDIAGDISAKRGQISGTDSAAGGMVTISGRVPLSELNNYQARLKSVTAGQGSFVMELSHYEPVPATVQQHLAAQYQHVDEDQ